MASLWRAAAPLRRHTARWPVARTLHAALIHTWGGWVPAQAATTRSFPHVRHRGTTATDQALYSTPHAPPSVVDLAQGIPLSEAHCERIKKGKARDATIRGGINEPKTTLADRAQHSAAQVLDPGWVMGTSRETGEDARRYAGAISAARLQSLLRDIVRTRALRRDGDWREIEHILATHEFDAAAHAHPQGASDHDGLTVADGGRVVQEGVSPVSEGSERHRHRVRVHGAGKGGGRAVAGSEVEGLELTLKEAEAFFRREMYHVMIKAYSSAGLTAQCEAVLNRMTAAGVPPTEETYILVVNALGRCTPPRNVDAERVFRGMEDAGIAPGLKAFNQLMAVHASVGDDTSVARVSRWLVESGLELSVVSYNTMINTFTKMQPPRPDDARQVFDLMQSSGMAPDKFSYSSLAQAYTRAGRMAEAEALLTSMHNDAPNRATAMNAAPYDIVMKGYAVQRPADAKAALQVFQLMAHRGVGRRLESYHAVMEAAGNAEPVDVHLADVLLDMLDDEKDLQVSAATYNLLAKCAADPRAGSVERVQRLIAHARDHRVKLDASFYNSVMKLYAQRRPHADGEKAQDVYSQMLARNVEPTVHTFGTLLTAQAKSKPPNLNLLLACCREFQTLDE